MCEITFPPKFLPLFLLSGLFLAAPLAAELAPQPPVALTLHADGSCDTDWQGVAGRVYLLQVSRDLTRWTYAPVIDFGTGSHHHTFTTTTPQGFFRLLMSHDPAVTSLEAAQNADFDGDGLSNIFEISFGYDPNNTSSTVDGADNALDPDGDGITNTTENTKGLNPMKKDNPKLLLQVTDE